MTTAHLLDSKGLLDGCLIIDTGINAPDWLDWMKAHLTYRYEITRTSEHFEEIVRKYGFGRPDSHNIYFNDLKEHAIQAWRRKIKAEGREAIVATGVRKLEERHKGKFNRRRFKNTKEVGKLGGFWAIAPIYNWTTARVWAYVTENRVEVYPNLGGLPPDCFCGCFTERGERRAMKRLYPFAEARIRALEIEVGGVWGNKNLPRHLRRDKNQSTFCEETGCLLEAIKAPETVEPSAQRSPS